MEETQFSEEDMALVSSPTVNKISTKIQPRSPGDLEKTLDLQNDENENNIFQYNGVSDKQKDKTQMDDDEIIGKIFF
jgi:hypothetical protein